MSANHDTIGFLSVLDLADLGFCGGFLVLNQFGRPVEFHCTLPVKPDRAQEILYGPTLRAFLHSEHIGRPLLENAKATPAITLVDDADSLELQRFVESPLAWIDPPSNRNDDPSHPLAVNETPQTDHHLTEFEGSCRKDVAERSRTPHLRQTQVGGYRLIYPAHRDPFYQNHQALLDDLLGEIRLEEPFQRIHEAIHEAFAVGG